MNALIQDIRYAVRGITRAPFLSLAVILALATGVGLNAAIFALVDGSWLQPPVDKNPSTFVRMIPSYSGWFDTEKLFPTFTVNDYNAILARVKSLREVAAYTRVLRATLDEDRSANVQVGLVTCNFPDVYGWPPPLKGRLFLPKECATGGSAPVAIMNENFWRNRYASDPHIIGKVVRINGHPYTVVGLVNVQTVPWLRDDLWVPYTMQADFWDHYEAFTQHPDYPWLFVAGRLKPGYSRAEAQSELQLIEGQQDRVIPGRKTTVQVTNGSLIQDPGARSIGLKIIPLIMGPMALILLVACTNVTMLLLARAAGRRGEMAIRLTLGAARGRLVRMLATEGLIIAAIAGILGAYSADKLPSALWAFLLQQNGFMALAADWRVFAFLAAITLIAACFAGLAPARESLKVNLVESLKGQEGASTARSRSRSILIVAQMAMSFVLVAAGVLFIRLQHSIASSDPGFETRHVFLVPLEVSAAHDSAQSAAALYRNVRERVSEVPGVRSASYTDTPPYFEPPDSEIRLPGETKGQGQRAVVEQVSTEFFSTMKIRIARGRAFRNSDAIGNSGGVALVSQTFARNFWGAKDPLGKVVLLPGGTQLLVVGVAADIQSSNFDSANEARLYVPQNPQAFTGYLLVRFDGSANSMAPQISRTIRELDSAQMVTPVTLQSMREAKAVQIRPLTQLILFMAIVAMLLALSGLYGTVAFSMSQRTREFGIRMALGASKERILGSVLLTGARQIGIGLVFGVLLAFPAAFAFRALVGASHLFDWSTYAIAALALAVSALCACYIPARRAMKVDPMVALRYE